MIQPIKYQGTILLFIKEAHQIIWTDERKIDQRYHSTNYIINQYINYLPPSKKIFFLDSLGKIRIPLAIEKNGVCWITGDKFNYHPALKVNGVIRGMHWKGNPYWHYGHNGIDYCIVKTS